MDRESIGGYGPCPEPGCTLALVKVPGLHETPLCPAHGMTPEQRVEHGVTEGPRTMVEALVIYQRMGDGTGTAWAHQVLGHAEGEGDLDGWAVLGEWQAGWVQVIAFTIQLVMPCAADGALDYTTARDWAHQMAAHVVGEDDVQVLGLKPVGLEVTP